MQIDTYDNFCVWHSLGERERSKSEGRDTNGERQRERKERKKTLLLFRVHARRKQDRQANERTEELGIVVLASLGHASLNPEMPPIEARRNSKIVFSLPCDGALSACPKSKAMKAPPFFFLLNIFFSIQTRDIQATIITTRRY